MLAPDGARWLACAVVGRSVAVALHELSHLLVASVLGHKATVRLDGPEASVQVSRPLSNLHDALIRHAGWIASLLLACFCIALYASVYHINMLLDLSQVNTAGGPELGFATLGVVLVALEALESDLLSEPRRGLFRCGNFGLLLLRQANAGRVDKLLRRMLQITMMRGAQSAGVVTYQEAVGVRHRVVNGKRTDLSKKLLDRASSITRAKSVSAPQIFQGHTRFATSSIADLGGTHPHQWTPRQAQTHWRGTPGGGMTSELTNVEAYITHNGDLDFFELHGTVSPGSFPPVLEPH